MTGQTSTFGQHDDLAAGGTVLLVLFIGTGPRNDALGAWPVELVVAARLAAAVPFLVLAGIATPMCTMFVLRQCRGLLVERGT